MLTDAQRKTILEKLREGAHRREACAIAGADWDDDFVPSYRDDADFRRDVEKERATWRSTLRLAAAEESGQKANALLALLRLAEAEEDVEELAPPDPFANLWSKSLPDDVRDMLRDVVQRVPVDAQGLIDGPGDWHPEGARLAAEDHEGRRDA